MNIKMNKIIKDLPFVKNFFVQPSGGDDLCQWVDVF